MKTDDDEAGPVEESRKPKTPKPPKPPSPSAARSACKFDIEGPAPQTPREREELSLGFDNASELYSDSHSG